MTGPCEQIQRAIERGDPELEPRLHAHAAQCDDCQARLQAAPLLGPAPDALAPAPGWRDLARRMDAEPRLLAWLRSLSVPQRFGLLTLFAVAVTGIQLLKLRADLATYPVDRMFAILVSLALATIPAWLLALRPLHRPPGPRSWTLAVLGYALLLPLGVALLPAAHSAHSAAQGGTGSALVPRAAACLVYGALFAAPVLGLSLAADRSGGRTALPWLLSAAAAGLVANLLLQLHCPLTHPHHMLAGHAPIGVALVATAAVASGLARFRRRAEAE